MVQKIFLTVIDKRLSCRIASNFTTKMFIMYERINQPVTLLYFYFHVVHDNDIATSTRLYELHLIFREILLTHFGELPIDRLIWLNTLIMNFSEI